MTDYSPHERFCKKIPDGDDKERLICSDCGWVHYENPKIIVGAVATWNEQILLCRRAIEPRKGFWTIPAGFMELCETAEEGAAREAWEEARARLRIDTLLGIYSIPRAAQVHLIYRAQMLSPEFGPGLESLDVKLVDWEQIPWEELAFRSNHWALKQYYESRALATFPPYGVPEEEKLIVSGRLPPKQS